MAQTIKLKRTAVQGKIPTTSNLDLGELAINTYDGRIFFEKDVDGTLSIQEILTTNSQNSGSFNLTGAISASSLSISGDTTIDGNLTLGGNITIGDSTSDSISVSADFSSSLIPDSGSTYDLGSSSKPWNEVHSTALYGDGSNITNITVDAAATVSSTFTNSSSVTISHNFNTRNILVAVYDNQNNQILPQNVNTSNLDQVVITLSSAQSGTVVVAKGGHIISGSADDSNKLNGELASHYLDYTNFTNIPSGIVSGSSQTIANLPTGVVSGSQSDARGQLGLDTGDSPTFTDLTLSGDLVVQGTTTTLNTTTFNVEDNIIELNYGGTATESGLFVKDSTGGSTTSGSLLWDATNDYWKAGISGSESKVLLANGDSIVSSSAQTILHLGGTDIISGSSQLDGTTIGASSDIVASGSFSGSYKGDGSGLTGIQVDQVVSVTASFDNQSTVNVSHNFDSYNVIVSTYDTNYNQLIPQTVSLTNTNTLQVVLSAAHSGHVVVAKGGHVVSGSANNANQLNGEAGSYYLDYDNFTNIPSGIVSQSAQTVAHLSNQDIDLGTGDITATTGSFDIIDLDRLSLTSTQTTIPPLQLTANSLNDGVGALRIDGSQADIFLNPSTATHTTVTFAVNNDQRLAFGMDNNSDFYITRRTGGVWYDDTLVLDRNTGEVTLGYDLTVNGNINATNGIISGSSQITDLTTYKETVSGASFYNITHSLDESYPFVQAWNTSNDTQEQPLDIESVNSNVITVSFSANFSGKIIVKK